MNIGGRIKQARLAARLSGRALAGQVGVSAMAISKYENNRDVPGSKVLMRLAQALGVSVEFFLRPVIIPVQIQAYRKRARLGIKEQTSIEMRIQEGIERYLAVESFFPDAQIQKSLPSHPIQSLEEAECVAEKIRQEWDLGLDAIENLVHLLEDQGIKVWPVDGYADFDACIFLANDQAVIAVKTGLAGDRQRYSLAHELGHLVMQIPESINAEKACNRFAGAFILPAPTLRRELGPKRSALNLQELALLKQKYGLSMQALIYRAGQLGIISASESARLFTQIAAKGWKKTDPYPLPEEHPTRMKQLVLRALAEDLLSHSRAFELLGNAQELSFAGENEPNQPADH